MTLGVDVGGTYIRAGVVDAGGTVLRSLRALTPGTDTELEDAIAELVDELSSEHPVKAVGLALAGFIAPDRRTVRFSPHLSWRDVLVADRIAERTGLAAVVEHDANVAALAEQRFGAGCGSDAGTMVYLALGTGIGAALLVDGVLYRGAYGVAPELGHLRMVPDGRPCPCGRRGCWERYCSGTALAATALELAAGGAREGWTGLTGQQVATRARAGDPVAAAAVADLARWLGEGLAVVADVFDPELVLLGGGVAGSADLFLDAAVAHYGRVLTGAGHRPLADVRVGRLGESAGVVGAAELAREAG